MGQVICYNAVTVSKWKVVLSMPREQNPIPLWEVIRRITLTMSLYECGVNENQIVDQLCEHCNCTENEAINYYVFEKTTRVPIRALQQYLEKEKGFPPDSRKCVFGSRLLQAGHGAGAA